MIRKAVESDIPFIIETGMNLHERSENSDVPVHKPTVFNLFRQFIVGRDKVFLISEHAEVVRGFLFGAVQSYWWADPVRGRCYATDWSFYSEIRGDGVLMLKAFQEWAWMMPRVVEVVCATNIPRNQKLLGGVFKEAGFDTVGGYYRARKPDAI